MRKGQNITFKFTTSGLCWGNLEAISLVHGNLWLQDGVIFLYYQPVLLNLDHLS